MPQNIGTTRLTVGVDAMQGPPGPKLLQAVQKAVAGEYEILGELGRGERGKVVYLARELASSHLVALQLLPASGAAGELWLEVMRKLDASVPSVEGACPRCGKAVQGWGRFCGHCGADLSGAAAGKGAVSDELLRVVKDAAKNRFEILGQMDRAEGGGVVYFARELATKRIVALRLQREASAAMGGEHYSLGVTNVIRSVVDSLGATYGPPEPTAPAARRPTLPPPRQPVVSVRDDAGAAPPVRTAVPAVPAVPASAEGASSGGAGAQGTRLTLPPRRWLVTGGAAALVLTLGVAAWAMRDDGDEPWVIDDEAPALATAAGAIAAPAGIDSAELRIGGTLPRGATVTVDGAPVAGTVLRLAPGRYTFRLRAAGYTPSTQELELAPGQTMVWTPQLVRAARGTAPRPAVPRTAATAATAATPAPRPAAAASAQPQLAQPAAAAATPLPDAPPAITAASCATLFGNLEWSRAAAACEREAAAGSVSAQRALGTIHERGLGVEPNAKAAATWYVRAAEAGDRVAQYRLGVLQRDGRGIRKNEKSAVAWFRRSAEQGEPDAQLALARAYDRGNGVKKDEREASAWYRQAAEQGSATAQYDMGVRTAKGEGVPKSEPEAIAWWRRAAAQGHAPSAAELRRRGQAP